MPSKVNQMKASQYRLVPFKKNDACQYAAQISTLFHHAVNSIHHPRYNLAQLQAWSKAPRSTRHWHNQLKYGKTWLMLELAAPIPAESENETPFHSGKLVGFISLETQFKRQGYISHLYVHPLAQGLRLGSQLILCAQDWALAEGYKQLSTDASYLSKGLFERHGFIHQGKSFQNKLAQVITGFEMTKTLSQS
jgi:putative acetyltransferase